MILRPVVPLEKDVEEALEWMGDYFGQGNTRVKIIRSALRLRDQVAEEDTTNSNCHCLPDLLRKSALRVGQLDGKDRIVLHAHHERVAMAGCWIVRYCPICGMEVNYE